MQVESAGTGAHAQAERDVRVRVLGRVELEGGERDGGLRAHPEHDDGGKKAKGSGELGTRRSDHKKDLAAGSGARHLCNVILSHRRRSSAQRVGREV